MSTEQGKTNIYAVRTIIGQEISVANLINSKAKKMNANITAILVSETLRGYVFVEATAQEEVDNIITGIPHVRGKVVGRVNIQEIEHVLIPRPPTEGLDVGDTVEIIGGPFKGERAKVERIDQTKSEVVLELLESSYPIPIKVHADYVKLIEKGSSIDDFASDSEELDQ
ncbi:MAG: transcription elongation factor Spt5 [Candidatus Odinarchaeia archaeon]